MELPQGSEYVALGSSYGAGPGLGDRVVGSPRLAGRSTHNYAHILSERLGLKLTDVTYSGATVAQILGKEVGATATPQVDAVTPATRLVTLTGGGNDLGYIGFLVTASVPRLLRGVVGGNRRLAELRNSTAIGSKAAQLADDLTALFDAIRSRAPEATIAITDYLAVLPPDSSIGAPPLPASDAELGREYWSNVNLTLRQVAARARVVFAEVSAVSTPHHAWSSDPWTERFVLIGGKAAPYHPNRLGMAAVANAIESAIRAV
jgi:lysophospholipase L1-like esterase